MFSVKTQRGTERFQRAVRVVERALLVTGRANARPVPGARLEGADYRVPEREDVSTAVGVSSGKNASTDAYRP